MLYVILYVDHDDVLYVLVLMCFLLIIKQEMSIFVLC